MECPNIRDLKFSQQSRQVINNIRWKLESAGKFSTLLGVGTMATIFLGSKTLINAYFITSTDWKLLAEAMYSVPNTVKNRVKLEANLQELRTNNLDERIFWGAVANGCSL